jgi:hypothetical protein
MKRSPLIRFAYGLFPVNPAVLSVVLRIPGYFGDWFRFRRLKGTARFVDLFPQLYDRTSATPFDPHYTYQAAWLPRRLRENHPERHVDVGSDVRMVVVMSGFVDTDYYDFRPFENSRLDGLRSLAGDVTGMPLETGSCASVSCLHVLEHIGLGRYGDPLDPDGFIKGFSELTRLVRPGGRLYVSFPIGRERTEFNAHRVLDPAKVVESADELELASFSCVDDEGTFHQNVDHLQHRDYIYGCGMFEFIKKT